MCSNRVRTTLAAGSFLIDTGIPFILGRHRGPSAIAALRPPAEWDRCPAPGGKDKRAAQCKKNLRKNTEEGRRRRRRLSYFIEGDPPVYNSHPQVHFRASAFTARVQPRTSCTNCETQIRTGDIIGGLSPLRLIAQKNVCLLIPFAVSVFGSRCGARRGNPWSGTTGFHAPRSGPSEKQIFSFHNFALQSPNQKRKAVDGEAALGELV